MAEEKTADQKKEEELSLAGRAGDAVWKAVVWDNELPWYVNAGLLATTAVSLAAAVPSGGSSLLLAGAARVAVVNAAKRVIVKEGAELAVETAAKVTAEKVAVETAAKVTAEKVTAEAAAKKAAEGGTKKKTFIENMLSDYPRRKGLVYLGWTVAGAAGLLKVGDVGLNWYENANGHPVAKWLADRARKNIDSLIEAGTLNEETLVNIIEGVASNLSFLKNFSSSVVGGMETGGFAIQLGDHPTPEEVQRVKGEALGFALKDPLLLLRAGLRARGAKHLFPDQNERDLYLTNKFVEDLVKGADNAAFSKENKITESDVKDVLKRLRARGGMEAEILSKFPHLENGLQQKWPDMFAAQPDPVAKPTVSAPTHASVTPPAVETSKPPVVTAPVVTAPEKAVVPPATTQSPQVKVNTPSALDALMQLDVSSLKGPDLSAAFDKAAKDFEKSSPVVGLLMGMAKGISSLFNAFGMNELANDFDRFVLRMAKGAVMVSQFGRFNLDNLKSHVPDNLKSHVPESKKPEVDLVPAPAP